MTKSLVAQPAGCAVCGFSMITGSSRGGRDSEESQNEKNKASMLLKTQEGARERTQDNYKGGSGPRAVQHPQGEDAFAQTSAVNSETSGAQSRRRNLGAGQIGEFSHNPVAALTCSRVSRDQTHRNAASLDAWLPTQHFGVAGEVIRPCTCTPSVVA